MYLITILRAEEQGHRGPVGLAALAERLEVAPASVNEKIRRMEDRGLVAYEPYKGASLTDEGREVALRVLRSRRLWACFLVDHLGFSPRQADAMACDLEHATNAAATDALNEFLGRPARDPFGAPIPDGPGKGATGSPADLPLAEATPGTRVEVVGVTAAPEAAGFLAASGLLPGTAVVVAAVGPGGLLVEGEGGPIHLSFGIAAAVRVRMAGDGDAV